MTFLFTDGEGSTKLLHDLGDEGYAEALVEHRRLIREACAAAGGIEVDTQGDARTARRTCAGNIRMRVVGKAVERANVALAKAGMKPITDGITNHSLRRTFASLLYEAGASPAYVMAQMGHTSSALALGVYAKKMARSRDTGERMDALLRGAD